MAFCPNCGEAIPNEAKFCPSCGAKNYAPDREPVEPNDTAPASYKPKRKKWPIVLIIILAALALLLILFLPRGVYAYRATTYKLEEEFSAEEQEQFESLFIDTYLYETEDDSYCIIDLISGLGGDTEDFDSADGLSISVSTSGNYAYVEFNDSETGESIIVSYSKPTIREYCYFVLKAGL